MEATIIKDTISKINNIKNNILFEASGNINEKNIKEYSETGVDVVSLGMLTHSVKAFDMSLEIK
jgi:nicotinate-nucleotide pyrophosphorylase (carboxylating)